MKSHLESRCFVLDFELHVDVSLSNFRAIYVCEKLIIQQIFIGANFRWIYILQINPICSEFSQGFIVSEKTAANVEIFSNWRSAFYGLQNELEGAWDADSQREGWPCR
jgi:hypothetical protein